MGVIVEVIKGLQGVKGSLDWFGVVGKGVMVGASKKLSKCFINGKITPNP